MARLVGSAAKVELFGKDKGSTVKTVFYSLQSTSSGGGVPIGVDSTVAQSNNFVRRKDDKDGWLFICRLGSARGSSQSGRAVAQLQSLLNLSKERRGPHTQRLT